MLWKSSLAIFILTAHQTAHAFVASPQVAPRHLISANHFSAMPQLTKSQRQTKCHLKMNFACACEDASTTYRVATSEPEGTVHPFCETNPTHRWCVGACKDSSGNDIDYPRKKIMEKAALGSDASGVQSIAGADSVTKCHDAAKVVGKDYFEFDTASSLCRIAESKGTYLTMQPADATVTVYHRTDSKSGCAILGDTNRFFQGNLNPTRSYSMKLRGQVIELNHKLSGGSATVVSNVTVTDCETAAGIDMYYSHNTVSKECRHGNEYTLDREDNTTVYGQGKNELRMCNADDRGDITLCDEDDPMCHSQPIINRLETKSLNFDQVLVHTSYNKIGGLRQCNYDGALVSTGGPNTALDREVYPLAPCPDSNTAFYCDFPRNQKFGDVREAVEFKADGSTNFECTPDVTIHLTDYKVSGVGAVLVAINITDAATCRQQAKTEGVEFYSYQANEFLCKKDNVTCDATLCASKPYATELECEQVHNRVWTEITKHECILSTNETVLSTTAQAGANIHKIHSRETTGMPDGIREYSNGYDKQAFQFSYETVDPVSSSKAVNEINTNQEVITMNIFTIGRLIKDKIVLSAQSEGSQDQATNDANAHTIMEFFDKLALTGDTVGFSTLVETKPTESEWFPTEVGPNDDGVTDMLRCHSVADTTIEQFRNFTDVREDFIETFFANAEAAVDQCSDPEDANKYDIAVLDDERDSIPSDEQFARCRNDALDANVLYPSLRKSFFNPITSDGYRSGFRKGQRMIKEYGRSTAEKGTISNGDISKTYKHDKLMVSLSKEQAMQCNTELPDGSGYLMLQKRGYPDSPDDGIMGNWGHGFDADNIKQLGFRFCRTSISITKIGKSPDTVLYQKFEADRSGNYLKKYSYKIEIQEDDCSDMNVQEEEPVAQGTSAPFSVQESEEVFRIVQASPADWCRTETGHYDSKQMDYSDGGVCLSHKQEPRKEGLSEDLPYGSEGFSRTAKCTELASGTDVTVLYPNKIDCEEKVGHQWSDFHGHFREDTGKCYVDATGALVSKGNNTHVCVVSGAVHVNITDLAACAAATPAGTWVDPVADEASCISVTGYKWEKKMISFGYIANVPNASITNLQRQTLSFTNVNADHYTVNEGSEEDPTLKLCAGDMYTIKRATAGHALNIKLNGVDQLNADVTEGNPQTWTPTAGTYQYYCVMHPTTMLGNLTVEDCPDIDQMYWEDSRLSCSAMGTSSGRSKYDRIRMTFFVDVLQSKDLFDEGRVNAGILPRGLPSGITEGAGEGTVADDCAECVSKDMVGQHKLGGDDHDDKRENITDADDESRKQSFEDGYRAVGYGKDFTSTYERVPPGNRQGHQDHNTLVQIVNRYIVRDVGVDAAAGGSKAFIDDSLTTISYLGVATSSFDPLKDTSQMLMEDEGDGKIYNRYLVELFSNECLDRTQPQLHSAQIQVQLFKDGRWPADRLADATASCDGTGLDISTAGALAAASAEIDYATDIIIDTEQVCGPIEIKNGSVNEGNLCLPPGYTVDRLALIFLVEQTGKGGCGGGGSIPLTEIDDIQECAALAFDAGYNRINFVQGQQCVACAVDDVGDATNGTSHMTVAPAGTAALPPTCETPSAGHYCLVCSTATNGCTNFQEKDRLIDMQCAGRNFHDKTARIGLNAKLHSMQGAEDKTNLQIVDIPATEQTRGSFYGAELVEFSLGVSLLDVIEFSEDYYLSLKGMDSRIETVAWVRNTELGNAAAAKDVRSMGDLVFPQITTEEIVITVQSFDRERDLNSWDLNIEGVSVCAHAPEDYLNSYVAASTISQEVVDCVTKGTQAACQHVIDTCPQRTDTGFNFTKQGDNYLLLAEYKNLFATAGHLFVDETCDQLSVSTLLQLLSFPDYGSYLNEIVYGLSKHKQGQEAVSNACVKPGSPTADRFFKMIGPQGAQTPASQTIVRNFKALLMHEARGESATRGIREVIPCRRMATHGDDMSYEFRNAILHGYAHESAFGNLSTFGSRFEPRDCFLDGYHDTTGNTSKAHSGDSENCMTNVLGHLVDENSFEDYLNNIGGASNYDEEICVQKNNIWREGVAGPNKRSYGKHIPCGYSRSGLFNFEYSSVLDPDFSMTDDEKAYRLSPASAAWDAIVYHRKFTSLQS